ncbi:hypothetical protein STEG23_023628, partial [Scotinomys teguina]
MNPSFLKKPRPSCQPAGLIINSLSCEQSVPFQFPESPQGWTGSSSGRQNGGSFGFCLCYWGRQVTGWCWHLGQAKMLKVVSLPAHSSGEVQR